MKVKDWYTNKFSIDTLGKEIDADLTFEQLFEAMDNYEDVYKTIGVFDSLIRERIFSKLAEVMCVDYDYVYDQWLKAK